MMMDYIAKNRFHSYKCICPISNLFVNKKNRQFTERHNNMNFMMNYLRQYQCEKRIKFLLHCTDAEITHFTPFSQKTIKTKKLNRSAHKLFLNTKTKKTNLNNKLNMRDTMLC